MDVSALQFDCKSIKVGDCVTGTQLSAVTIDIFDKMKTARGRGSSNTETTLWATLEIFLNSALND